MSAFRLEVPIGAGGQGTVWRATHVATGLPVALKRLDASRPRPDLAEAELRAVAALDHEAVVAVVDFALDDDPPWIAFEWMPGGALPGAPPGDWAGVDALARRLLAALAHAHARGVSHRDVKPDNVLLDYVGRPVLADFGLAGAGARAGSAPWKAPEQVRGAGVGPAADLYGLGGTVWWCVAGEPPFGAGLAAQTYDQAHLSWPLPPLTPRMAVPPGLRDWLERMLAREPADRFPSAPAALAALGALGAAPAPYAPPTEGPRRAAADATRTDTDDTPSTAPATPARPWTAPAGVPELPAGWRRPSAPRAAAFAGAGLRLLPHRFPPELGRERERDRLWAAARRVAAGGAPEVVVLEGPPGSGRAHLARWLQRTVAELAGPAFGLDPAGVGGLSVQAADPGEGPPDAVRLGPLDAAEVRAALVRCGFEGPTATRLEDRAAGHPGALVALVEALRREGALVPTPTGLRVERPGGGLPEVAPGVRVPEALRRAVTAAALLGSRVDPADWLALAPDRDAALAWLLARRWVSADPGAVTWLDPWTRNAARAGADAELLAAAAARVDDPVAAAELWLGAGRPEAAVAALTPVVGRSGPLAPLALALWEEATALAPAPPAARRRGLVHRYYERLGAGSVPEARELAERILAEAGDDADARAMAVVALAGAEAFAGRLEEAWARVDAACAGPPPADEVAAVCWSLRGQLAARTGRWPLAVPSLERALALRVSEVRRTATLLLLAQNAVMAGEPEAAARALDQAAPHVSRDLRPPFLEAQGRLAWARGGRAEAEAAFRACLRAHEETGTPDPEQPLLALARCVLGDRPDEARALADRALRAGVGAGRVNDVTTARCVLVVALGRLGAAAEAEAVLGGLDLAVLGDLVARGDRTLRWRELLAEAEPHLGPTGRAALRAVLAALPAGSDPPHAA